MHKLLTVELSDGSVWGVPVEMIARDRAKHYAHEFGGDIERSLAEDTIPLFEEDDYEIQDWARNNMNWTDFDGHQVEVTSAPLPSFFLGWAQGDMGFFDEPVTS